MSGIAGMVGVDEAATRTQLEAMLQAMTRRGPDRQALWCQDNAGFAQALLATTPEAIVERQPWQHPETGCVVVSDSRLDHRPALLRELGIDRDADSVGDGELLHAAWQRWGHDCCDRLRGDFAFAIWDARAQSLFLARDPMGVRPMAFYVAPGRRFVFGSTADVVIAHGAVPRDIDEGRIADALIGETEGIDPICTFYSAVQRLPPAHWLQWRDGVVTQARYWRPVGERPAALPRDDNEWIAAQREQLDRAVRLRLRSQRPVGSMLSGGLDSSSVVALGSAAYTAAGREPFPVFSATHAADANCAETRNIRAVIAHVRCAPTLVDLAEYARDVRQDVSWWTHAEEPFDGSMSLLAAVYAAAAKQGVVSVLDGVPADNLYVTGRHAQHLFNRGRWRDAWRAAHAEADVYDAPAPRLQAWKVLAGCAMPRGVHALRARWQMHRAFDALLRDSLVDPGFARRIDLRARYTRFSHSVGASHQWHASEEALSSMAAPYITAGIERYNRVASLHGVEPRLPYVDRDLIAFQAWMPIALRARDGHAKWVLRMAMANHLPADVAWRRDKRHVGWHFNRVQMDRQRSSGAMAAMANGDLWLDAAKRGRLMDDSDRTAGDRHGVMAAARLLVWLQGRAHTSDKMRQ